LIQELSRKEFSKYRKKKKRVNEVKRMKEQRHEGGKDQ
jgi:hypothetical protein